MIIKNANYVGSYVNIQQCPKTELPEYAFAGRSNVGKSSLINMLLGRKSLAHVSHTPGKTQTLNFFTVNNKWHLVDLPGYGYAKVSKAHRKRWKQMVERYLIFRQNLRCLFVLIDARIAPQNADIEFLSFLGENKIPFVICFTKADKENKKIVDNQKAFTDKMLETWEQIPETFITSARARRGQEEVLGYIEKING